MIMIYMYTFDFHDYGELLQRDIQTSFIFQSNMHQLHLKGELLSSGINQFIHRSLKLWYSVHHLPLKLSMIHCLVAKMRASNC